MNITTLESLSFLIFLYLVMETAERVVEEFKKQGLISHGINVFRNVF